MKHVGYFFVAVILAIALYMSQLEYGNLTYDSHPASNSYDAIIYIERDVTQPYQDYTLVITEED